MGEAGTVRYRDRTRERNEGIKGEDNGKERETRDQETEREKQKGKTKE